MRVFVCADFYLSIALGMERQGVNLMVVLMIVIIYLVQLNALKA